MWCRAFTLFLAGLILVQDSSAQEEGSNRSKNNSLPMYDTGDEEWPNITAPNRALSDEIDRKKSGGISWPSLPKPKLPALPKPSLPKLSLPTWGSAKSTVKPRASDEPSTWEKFNSGTKTFFTKTKQTLMPWTSDDETSSARKKTPPARSTARTSSRKAKTEKKPFFSSWLETREEEKPIKTVNDYLAQPRVPY